MWDGSWLTKASFLRQWDFQGKKIAVITYGENEEEICCQYNKLDDSLAIIIDEMAPLFKLSKRGTHRAIIGKTKYILYRVEYINGVVIAETSLSSTMASDPLRKNEQLRIEVRKQIIFQDLIAINRLGESHIILRLPFGAEGAGGANGSDVLNVLNEAGRCPYIILGSYTDKKDLNDKLSLTWSNISPSLRAKYFDEKNSIHTVLKTMINKDELCELNYEIEQIIKRINREYLWFANFIINRLRRYF